MFTLSCKFGSVLFGVVILGSTAWAGSSLIEGKVVDQKGQPLVAADIRVENAGGSSWNKMIKTDAKGYYICSGLSGGSSYRVSLLVKGAVKASINNVKVNTGGTTMNFDLQKTSGSQANESGKKKTHRVWMAAETGSNIGGRWVEVEEDRGALPGADNVKKGNNETIRQMQMGAR